jgi:flagellar basal-body rod modification protein FlgD
MSIAGTNTANASANVSNSGTTAANPLTSLAGNFNDFLSLLTTQLQNQDPTSPMDTSQFTSQLVQFTGVAEQITANSTLSQILTVNQTQQLTQASGLVGQQVTFTGGTLPLQNGSAQVDFQTTSAEPVQITVTNSSGIAVQSQTVNATSGANTWTWNGTDASGRQQPDGSYTVAVTAAGAALPFQSVGTVTGAEQVNQAVQLQFGTTTVPYSQVVSMGSS